MANEEIKDARNLVSQYSSMGTSGAASQSTLLRNEQVRIRQAVLTGTLNSAATTRVFMKAVKDPIILAFNVLAVNVTTDRWYGFDYGDTTINAADQISAYWDGPSVATSANRNSFVLTVGSNYYSHAYRIWCVYAEKL